MYNLSFIYVAKCWQELWKSDYVIYLETRLKIFYYNEGVFFFASKILFFRRKGKYEQHTALFEDCFHLYSNS